MPFIPSGIKMPGGDGRSWSSSPAPCRRTLPLDPTTNPATMRVSPFWAPRHDPLCTKADDKLLVHDAIAAPESTIATAPPSLTDPMHLPSITALRALDAIARHGTVSRAASELFLTRSAISHQISVLEQTLGFAVT